MLEAIQIKAPGESRSFFETALGETSASALAARFRAAAASEGVSRHFCALHGRNGSLELLSCDYPFDPQAVEELGCLRFTFDDQAGSRLSVTMGGLPPKIDSARRARLHGLAMIFATSLPPLLDAGEPAELGSVLSEAECSILKRLLLGESELDIALALGVPIRSVHSQISAACRKLGAQGSRAAIVVSAQRGLLNLQS